MLSKALQESSIYVLGQFSCRWKAAKERHKNASNEDRTKHQKKEEGRGASLLTECTKDLYGGDNSHTDR